MSFILDALKKIEQDKRREVGLDRAESVAMSHAAPSARRSILKMAVVALLSAVVTAGLVSLMSGPSPGPADATLVDSVTPHAAAPADSVTPHAAAPADSVTPHAAEPADSVTPHAAEPAPMSAPETEESDEKPQPRRAPVPEPEHSRPTPREAAAEPEEAPPEPGADDLPEDTPPVRLVGRERALLNAVRPEGTPPAPETETTPSPDAPASVSSLTLQGTSVIDGRAVAVISDQRVFEGDFIDGALVVRIGEREVELEVDGRRYTLKL